MAKPAKHQGFTPEDWGLSSSPTGTLLIAGVDTVDLADTYGTPLHVVDEERLFRTAADFQAAFTRAYPGRVSVHYAFKCNPVPGVIRIIRQAGLRAEVMCPFEVALARQLGYEGEEIIVNGPFKPLSFLQDCLDQQVRLVIVDGEQELYDLDRLAGKKGLRQAILLRINPNYIPKGMNSGTATGSRKGSALGFDYEGGAATAALKLIPQLKNIRFQGFHFHIGSGMRFPADYEQAIVKLQKLVRQAQDAQLDIQVLDVGGGIGAPRSWEMSNWELLKYTLTNRLPTFSSFAERPAFSSFAASITRGIKKVFAEASLPELILEPGRAIVSDNQLLLLRVHQFKDRPGIGKWITTDGGIGTVTMPTYYEYHELFLCNDTRRPRTQLLTVNGPGCFAADQVYRNKQMPEVYPGEVLAVMDSGAYFTSWESNFGFPRPAIVAVNQASIRLLRHRETFAEMTIRDVMDNSTTLEETKTRKNNYLIQDKSN